MSSADFTGYFDHRTDVRLDPYGFIRKVFFMRSPMKPVFRFESEGEAGVSFPSLSAAIRYVPQHAEARIATSAEGVVLAEACPVAGPGTMLKWVMTNAGQDVIDWQGWSAGAPTLSPAELEMALAIALGDELRGAA